MGCGSCKYSQNNKDYDKREARTESKSLLHLSDETLLLILSFIPQGNLVHNNMLENYKKYNKHIDILYFVPIK